MSNRLRVIQIGLGAIGCAAARLVLARPSLQLVAAVDPQLAGQDLGPVLGYRKKLGLVVRDKLPAIRADAVVHCTGSDFATVAPQLEALARAGLSGVTSCEEALYPALRHRALAARLDRVCRQHGVAFVGAGVNPGFVMDVLPALVSVACRQVRAVRVLRIVDAATRRPALQQKVGVGLTLAEFRRRVRAGTLRHVGLPESLAFLAAALGRPVRSVRERITPVRRADGRVAGVRQIASAGPVTLELQMYAGALQPRDEIQIAGDPPLRVVVAGGTPGDMATPAILVNLLPRVVEARPGLHTLQTLALPRLAA